MAGRLTASFRHEFESGAAVNGELDLDPRAGRITVLFGPSGSGKTTVLRCLAGLQRPRSGFIRYDGETWFDATRRIHTSPQQRRLGYVSQEYGLFPHLTVEDNVRFGMRPEPADARARVEQILRAVHLEGFANRVPSQLSGGQRQRVALARVLAREPRLILLDEPLGALDLPLRDPVRRDLREFLHAVDAPSVLVTHDRADALAIGDRMVVMVDGSVRQTGAVEDVFSRPVDATVAAAVGVETVVAGDAVATHDGVVTVRAGGALIHVVHPSTVSGAVLACIRAEDVLLGSPSLESGSARNHWSGRVVDLQRNDATVRVAVDCGFPLVATVTKQSIAEMHLSPGAVVTAAVKATAIHLIPR